MTFSVDPDCCRDDMITDDFNSNLLDYGEADEGEKEKIDVDETMKKIESLEV